MSWIVPLLAVAFFLLSRPAPIQVPEVTAEQAKALIDAGALVIDVRGGDAFDARHLPAAISLPVGILSREIPKTLTRDLSRPIIVYCNDGANSGPKGTKLLRDAGFSGAVNLKSGIEGWSKAGLPVQR